MALTLAPALAIAGCSGGLETGSLSSLASVPLPKVELPAIELPKVDLAKVELPKVELPEAVPPVTGTPTEVYTRVARGILSCWFGASGPLKGRYIYHADADSPARGGRSEIAVHERDPLAKDPRGGRALRISIAPEGETAKVTYENYKLPSPMGDQLRRDIDRWAADRMGCQAPTEQAAWSAETKGAAAAAPKAARKPGSRHAKSSP